ncbi:MAG TPA: ParB N-terminal domain-containing protein [Patescibacteria group bacterium]
MKNFDITSLEGALAATQNNQLEEWIHAFLVDGSNPNAPLSEGLKAIPSRVYSEPILFPLSKLTRVCGPEEGMEYTLEKEGWERKIATLVERVKSGWNPQPLLSAGTGDEAFTIRDGSHRYETLVRAGIKKYWVIFFFDNDQDKNAFMKIHI